MERVWKQFQAAKDSAKDWLEKMKTHEVALLCLMQDKKLEIYVTKNKKKVTLLAIDFRIKVESYKETKADRDAAKLLVNAAVASSTFRVRNQPT